MGILSIITGLLPLLVNLLTSDGIISKSLSSLIINLSTAIPALVAGLLNGGGVTNDIIVVLQAIQAEVNALKTSSAVFTLNQANEINALDTAITAAIKAYNTAKVTDDPSNLTPLPTTL